MQLSVKIAIIFIVFGGLFACKKKDPTPVAPVISFLNGGFAQDNSYTVVNFEFYDGDGDLGLTQDENTGEQEFNLYVDYYEKVNGEWKLKSPVITYNTTEAKYDTTELHLRVPFVENEAKQALEGETQVSLFYDFNADTFRYEITMQDRALQLSNTITTSEFVVN